MKSRFYVLTCLVLFSAFSVFSQALSFTTMPSLTQDGSSRWWVDFAVSENTDVEVSIVRLSDSSVVRHLAAGMLGANAPAPLASNSLTQHIEWDVKDDLGNTVSNPGSMSVRVRAGMSPRLANIVGENYYKFGRKVMGLAQDPASGAIYVFGVAGTLPHTTIREYDGAGTYMKTVFPYASNLTASQVSGYGIVEWGDGTYSPKTTFIAFPNITKTLVTDQANTMWPTVINGEITVFSPRSIAL